MTSAREEFLWMLAELQDNATSLSDAAQQRIIDIETRVDDGDYVDPMDSEVHIVRVPFSEQHALAVRTNVEEAVAIAQIYNADRDGHLAEVTTYRTHGLAKGINVEVPSA